MVPDTIAPVSGDPQSQNRYSYTQGNPVKYLAPTGHKKVCGTQAEGGCGGTVTTPPTESSHAEVVAAIEGPTSELGVEQASVSHGSATAAIKQYLYKKIEQYVPPPGVVSYGVCGALGAAGYGTACAIIMAVDSTGNVNIGGGTLGIGGVLIFTSGVTGTVTWLPKATDVSQLGGAGVIFGVTGGEGLVGGADWVTSAQGDSEYLHGVAADLGFGVTDWLIPFPVENHVAITQT